MLHAHPERGDGGCAAFGPQTLMALRGGDWVRGGRTPRFAPCDEPTPLFAITFAILLGFIGALLALFLKNGNRAGRFLAAVVACLVCGDVYGARRLVLRLTFIIGGLIGAILL